MDEKIVVYLEKDSPRTNAIMGALLSGGDPLKLAQMIVDSQEITKGEKS
jgi:hypothetical protein